MIVGSPHSLATIRLTLVSLSILRLALAHPTSISGGDTDILGDQVSLQCSNTAPPPTPEPIDIVELILPPVAPNASPGSCNEAINPHNTGCINGTTNLQSGSFTIDGKHVVSNVEFVGSSNGSIYSESQIILIKADGTFFSNGDAWKCLTCGIPSANAPVQPLDLSYPQAFKDGKRLLAGSNIIDCGHHDLTDDECTPSELHVCPIHWTTSSDPSSQSGVMRELRIHPDDTHLAWSSFTDGGQLGYVGRLEFNASLAATTNNIVLPHYDLTHINLLVSSTGPPPMSISGNDLTMDPSSITIGEVRGFSGTGSEITYIGYPRESFNIDVFAINLYTGTIRRLTAHPEYVDPVDISPDDAWHVVMDTHGSGRQMFLSAMRGILPITDLLSTAVTSSTRNNGQRRFFQPYLIDRYGDRDDYFGQRINAAGDGSPGSINDDKWNGLADPKRSPDGTKIVYHQGLVTAPACGGRNPLPCPKSTAKGGSTKRVMLARLISRRPISKQSIIAAPDSIPWATRYIPGQDSPLNSFTPIEAGTYTLTNALSGTASITISTILKTSAISRINVTYNSYVSSDFPFLILSGTEDVSVSRTGTTYHADWYSNLTQIDMLKDTVNTKRTSEDGFHLSIDILTNIFNATGWLSSEVDGIIWQQPDNGT